MEEYKHYILGIYLQVREKRAELDIIKLTFARKACQYLRDYFANSVDSMMNDKSSFSQVYVFYNILDLRR